MAVFSQYDYLFAVGTIFSFLDAWNIGANDVANSWASSVSSRSLTYIQAMCGAAVLEFAGAVGVGGRVADTIRTKVVDTESFEGSPSLLMLGMVSAVMASALYLSLATRLGMPVSTTHSILGGVLGMGVGALGSGGVTWVGYKDDGSVDITKGVVQVFLAWIIAPLMSGAFGAILFTITKFGVLLRSNPTLKGLILFPIYFWLTGSLIAMLLLWKGGDYDINLTQDQVPGVIVAAGAAWGLLIAFFMVPWLYRVIIKDDWQLTARHIIKGPLLLRRGEVPPPPEDFQGVVRDFYDGHLTREELDAKRAERAAARTGDVEAQHEAKTAGSEGSDNGNDAITTADNNNNNNTTTASNPSGYKYGKNHRRIIGPKPEGVKWYSTANLWYRFKWVLLRGVDIDIIAQQKREDSVLGGDIEEIHAHSAHYDNKTEYLYTFLQIMTAASASFVHGANDVANAIGPYATIYQVWQQGIIPPQGESRVPVWILAFGGIGIAIGCWTYGYRIMRNLGNRITLISPSRGFCMELGSVITVVVATRLKLPVSTTQCITGAIVGVGLCNGEWRAINWRMVAWIYMGWFITVPTAGTLAGCIMAFITYAPNWAPGGRP